MIKTVAFPALILVLITGTAAFAQNIDEKKLDSIFKEAQTYAQGNKEQTAMPSGQDLAVFKESAAFRILQEENQNRLLTYTVVITPLFLFLVLLFIRISGHYGPDHIIHGSALVLVIQATIFLVIASATHEQLTGGIGVLGAIAGYLFGASSTRQAGDHSGKNKKPAADNPTS
jgi:hypothetical protein